MDTRPHFIKGGLFTVSRKCDMRNIEIWYKLRQRATAQLSAAKVAKLKAMQESGYTTSEIAKAVGVSASTVGKYLRGKAE